MHNIIIRYSLSAICILYLLTILIFGFDLDLIPYSIIVLFLVNIYMLISSRNNFMFFFVAFVIFYSNYSIVYANFINYLEVSLFTEIITPEVTVVSLNILVFFNCCLFLVFRWYLVKAAFPNYKFIEESKKNLFIIFLLSIALLLIFRFGYSVPDQVGERGSSSALYEYSIILFILFFYYCGNNRIIVYWGLFLVFIYSVQGFVFGGRIEGIQLLLCVYFMLFMNKIKMYKVVVAFVTMFLLMSIVGAVRGEIVSGNYNANSILERIIGRGFALDTSYAAYYCSETFVYTKKLLSDSKIMELFFSFLKSLFIGGASGTDASLPAVSAKYTVHQGGGLLPFYFYFYLGGVGIVISSVIVGLYLNGFLKLGERSNGLAKCVMVLVACTVFRWYLYSPLMLLRGALFMIFAYYGLFIINKLTKPNHSHL